MKSSGCIIVSFHSKNHNGVDIDVLIFFGNKFLSITIIYRDWLSKKKNYSATLRWNDKITLLLVHFYRFSIEEH